MRLPLWLNATLGKRAGNSVEVDLSLAVCRNCGKPKAISDPCGFDHLAAVMEFAHAAQSGPYEQETP